MHVQLCTTADTCLEKVFIEPLSLHCWTRILWEHTLELWCCAGATLLRYDLRRPGAAAAPRKLHVLSDGDAFVALAAPGAGAQGARSGGGRGASPAGFRNLLAAATLREVLLLDLRRPDQALLKWAHGAALRLSPCIEAAVLLDVRCAIIWNCWLTTAERLEGRNCAGVQACSGSRQRCWPCCRACLQLRAVLPWLVSRSRRNMSRQGAMPPALHNSRAPAQMQRMQPRL